MMYYGYLVKLKCDNYLETEGLVMFKNHPLVGDHFMLPSDGKAAVVKQVNLEDMEIIG